jgi:acyl-CoA thioesterase I
MKIIISICILLGVAGALWYFFMPKEYVPTVSYSSLTEEPGPQIRIIAFGDSLTAGYGLGLSESYPAQLEKRLRADGYDVQVINSGVSGETTAVNTTRAEFIRTQQPEMVILGIGGNDALRFVPIAETEKNMRQTLTTLLGGNNPPKVILLSIQSPSNAGSEYKTQFDALYPKLAAEFNVPLVPFIVEEVSRNASLVQADGIHPTKAGYAVLVAKYIAPAVEAVLKK